MKKIIAIFCSLSFLLAGCASVEPYNYANLNKSKPRSILVLPPINNTPEVGAPYTFISTISKPLAEKGYYVFPVAVVDTLLKENGLPTPDEMNAIPLDKLQQHTNADAVLYVTINEWGQNYSVLSSNLTVNSDAKLVDARTGEVLWETNFFFEQASNNGGGGLAGALVGAIVTQVIGTLDDRTPGVSSLANHSAINNEKRGLLPGPYKVNSK